MAPETEFRFNTKFDQTILLGKKARNVAELIDGIWSVPDASIYFHTHKFLQQHHYLSPEPPNDFAYWVTNVLNEETLGEHLWRDRKSTRLNSSHQLISYAVFCLKKK